jgi:NADP-dependent 3-hydroxy acid dehydrogenase YdfG
VLAGQGAAVALAARRKERLDELAAEIEAKGGKALVIEADITDQEQAIAAVKRSAAELGGLDIVVNNAGVMLLGPVLDSHTEDWDRMVQINVLGLLYVTHAALPYLLTAVDSGARGVADLVNISSVAGRTTRPGSNVYNLTKHGVGAFSESLRQEVTGRNVRVSLVEPGAVNTELGTHLRPEIRAQLGQRLAEVERLEAEDIADAIEYIVSRPRRIAINEILIRPTDQQF